MTKDQKKKAVKFNLMAEAFYNKILEFLKPLKDYNAIYSLAHATYYLDSMCPRGSVPPAPSRSTVAQALHHGEYWICRLNLRE